VVDTTVLQTSAEWYRGNINSRQPASPNAEFAHKNGRGAAEDTISLGDPCNIIAPVHLGAPDGIHRRTMIWLAEQ
jgi:hypothetical protein